MSRQHLKKELNCSKIEPPDSYMASRNLPYEEREIKRVLCREGLYIAAPNGAITHGVFCDPIDIMGIAKGVHPTGKRSFLERIGLADKNRYFHIGTLWVDYRPAQVSRESNWVLEVFGIENVQKLSEIVEGIADKFRVALETRLVEEKSKETYWADAGD